MPIPDSPLSRREQYLNAIATGDTGGLPNVPLTRTEQYLDYIAKNGGGGGGGSGVDNVARQSIGTLSNLNTEDKSNLVAAINEVLQTAAEDAQSVLPTDTASGAIASFPDGADDAPVKSLVAQIAPVQSGSGDPSPTNIRPISGFTGCKVSRTGKNLFDKSKVGSLSSIVWAYEEEGFLLKGGLSYTLSVESVDPNTGLFDSIGIYETDKTTRLALSYLRTVTYTPTEDIRVVFRFFKNGGVTQDAVDTIQLELGSTATDYESYQGDTYTIAFPAEAGTVYGGTLDVTSGVLTVDMAIVDMGSISYSTSGVRNDDDTGYTYYFRNTSFKDRGKILSSQFKTVAVAPSWKMLKVNTCVATDDFYFVFCADYPNAGSFKAAMSGVQLLYELANPITYQLTPTEVKTLLGVNSIWADTGDVAVDYRADTGLYIQKLTGRTEEDMIADAPIASGKYFLVGNTLYLSTAAIAAGATLTPGTNCVKTNLAEALNALNS